MTALMVMAFMTLISGCGKKAEENSGQEESASESAMIDISTGQPLGAKAASEETEASLEDRIASMTITIWFGETAETLDGTTLSGWITSSPDGRVTVDEEAAKAYVADLASEYDTFGLTRNFTTHGGKQIKVSGGDYGYWLDRVSTRQEIIDTILTGESAEIEPVYYSTAKSFDLDNIGNTYVEINIGAQHLWVYKDGEVVNESDFVSGGLFKGNSTPEGTYSITYKERDATLVGEGYESSVKYWMPFNGNIGLHDASWRDEFGGHIYYFTGSHGCINLPTAKAAEIYDQVEKGEPVVVYGSITKEEATENLTMDDKVIAAQKGFIPLTEDISTYIFEQQGFDHETAAALAAAGTAADESAEGDSQESEGNEGDEQDGD